MGCPPRFECVEDLDLDCTPLYEPTFDAVYAETLEPTCGQGSFSCHSSGGARGGLVFEDPDESYDLLLDGRVVPGDAACSLLVIRLEHDRFEMPPGEPLSEEERCAIRQWVAAGAHR